MSRQPDEDGPTEEEFRQLKKDALIAEKKKKEQEEEPPELLDVAIMRVFNELYPDTDREEYGTDLDKNKVTDDMVKRVKTLISLDDDEVNKKDPELNDIKAKEWNKVHGIALWLINGHKWHTAIKQEGEFKTDANMFRDQTLTRQFVNIIIRKLILKFLQSGPKDHTKTDDGRYNYTTLLSHIVRVLKKVLGKSRWRAIFAIEAKKITRASDEELANNQPTVIKQSQSKKRDLAKEAGYKKRGKGKKKSSKKKEEETKNKQTDDSELLEDEDEEVEKKKRDKEMDRAISIVETEWSKYCDELGYENPTDTNIELSERLVSLLKLIEDKEENETETWKWLRKKLDRLNFDALNRLFYGPAGILGSNSKTNRSLGARIKRNNGIVPSLFCVVISRLIDKIMDETTKAKHCYIWKNQGRDMVLATQILTTIEENLNGDTCKRLIVFEELEVGYRILPSTIEGAGLGFFATKDYKKGSKTPIIQYKGQTIGPDEFEKRKKSGSKYLARVNKDMFIDASDQRYSNAARYINRGEKTGIYVNNAELRVNSRKDIVNVWATRDINKGDEVFMPYGTSFRIEKTPIISIQKEDEDDDRPLAEEAEEIKDEDDDISSADDEDGDIPLAEMVTTKSTVQSKEEEPNDDGYATQSDTDRTPSPFLSEQGDDDYGQSESDEAPSTPPSPFNDIDTHLRDPFVHDPYSEYVVLFAKCVNGWDTAKDAIDWSAFDKYGGVGNVVYIKQICDELKLSSPWEKSLFDKHQELMDVTTRISESFKGVSLEKAVALGLMFSESLVSFLGDNNNNTRPKPEQLKGMLKAFLNTDVIIDDKYPFTIENQSKLIGMFAIKAMYQVRIRAGIRGALGYNNDWEPTNDTLDEDMHVKLTNEDKQRIKSIFEAKEGFKSEDVTNFMKTVYEQNNNRGGFMYNPEDVEWATATIMYNMVDTEGKSMSPMDVKRTGLWLWMYVNPNDTTPDTIDNPIIQTSKIPLAKQITGGICGLIDEMLKRKYKPDEFPSENIPAEEPPANGEEDDDTETSPETILTSVSSSTDTRKGTTANNKQVSLKKVADAFSKFNKSFDSGDWKQADVDRMSRAYTQDSIPSANKDTDGIKALVNKWKANAKTVCKPAWTFFQTPTMRSRSYFIEWACERLGLMRDEINTYLWPSSVLGEVYDASNTGGAENKYNQDVRDNGDYIGLRSRYADLSVLKTNHRKIKTNDIILIPVPMPKTRMKKGKSMRIWILYVVHISQHKQIYVQCWTTAGSKTRKLPDKPEDYEQFWINEAADMKDKKSNSCTLCDTLQTIGREIYTLVQHFIVNPQKLQVSLDECKQDKTTHEFVFELKPFSCEIDRGKSEWTSRIWICALVLIHLGVFMVNVPYVETINRIRNSSSRNVIERWLIMSLLKKQALLVDQSYMTEPVIDLREAHAAAVFAATGISEDHPPIQITLNGVQPLNHPITRDVSLEDVLSPRLLPSLPSTPVLAPTYACSRPRETLTADDTIIVQNVINCKHCGIPVDRHLCSRIRKSFTDRDFNIDNNTGYAYCNYCKWLVISHQEVRVPGGLTPPATPQFTTPATPSDNQYDVFGVLNG